MIVEDFIWFIKIHLSIIKSTLYKLFKSKIMKKLVFFLFFLPVFANAQLKEEVVNLSGKNAQEMYTSAKEWFALSPNPGNITIQVDNPVEQKLIGKGVKNIVYTLQKSPSFIDVSYALSVQFKDGRYKYLLDVSSIKYEDGYEMSYEDFKSLATKEGWNAYCKKTGIKPQFRSKLELATFNDVYSLLNKNFDNLIADLTTHLKSDKKEVSW